MPILRGAEPFLLMGGKKGILLIHGFTGSPAEMVLLGEHLHREGYTVLGPRLCGHGTTPEELAVTNWAHWYNSVRDGYHLLKGICESVSVIGLSMGGLLAIRLGLEFELEKVAALSSPIYIQNRGLRFLPSPRNCVGRYVPKKRRKLRGVDPIYTVSYNRMPMSSIHSLLGLIRYVAKNLPTLMVPLLVVQSKNDHTVKPSSASYIYRSAGSNRKELFWLDKSGHLVTLDVEKEIVFQKITSFLSEV